MEYDFTNPYELAKYIKSAQKSTPVKIYLNGYIDSLDLTSVESYGSDPFHILFGESLFLINFLMENSEHIINFRIEHDRRNSAIPLLNLIDVDARIEPGAIIRDKVQIAKGAIIMMGAVINIAAKIGEGSMIDMNSVIGARGVIGRNVHVGAGAVIAGVLEPPSSSPCTIEDDVLIGANAVVLEGVTIGHGSVVAAGSVVTENVPPNVVVAGTPAKIIKSVDSKTREKTKLMDDLR